MAIATLPFGRSGHQSTRTIFGGAALAHVTQQEADQALELLLRYGVNHLDVAASYGDAELHIAPWLRQHREQFFVATKTGQRTAAKAREELERSLERLGIAAVDLWQLHNLADPIEWDVALSPGGALDAAIEARREGLVRHVGVTGHGLQIAATHRRSLARFDFDSVLLPYNYLTLQSDYYAANFEALVAACAHTWYEPLTEQHDIDLAVHWALKRPGIFLNTAGDLTLLPKVLDAASRFQADAAPTDEQMRALVERLGAEPLFV